MTKILNILLVIVMMGMGVPYAKAQQVTKNNLDQNADQSQGNYAPTNLNYLGSGSLGMMQSAWKDPLQHMGEGQSRPGYSKYYWTPDLVLPVRLREGMYTLINFPNWEVIENVYLGDGTSFDAKIEGPSSLMVYPADMTQFIGVDTNMIVFGRSGNKYVFYVQSETVNTDRITNAIIDIEVVKKAERGYSSTGGKEPRGSAYINKNGYAYDGNSAANSKYTRNLQREDWIENIPMDPTQFRFDIEVYVPNPDDIIIAPERVWRDNIFTYIDLGEKALTAVQRPIVTLIVERSETPVGFRSAGPNNRLIIVEGMGDMVLRSGKRIVCLKLRRADTDGLENSVYAKSNEWDLQTAYASQPPENTQSKESTQNVIEDVYNGSSTKVNNDNQSNNIEDFFTSNSFTDKNAQNENKSDGKVASQSNKTNIDSLPKVTPIIATKNETTEQPKLTGQYDVQVGNSEVIEADYNNQNMKVDVSYKSDASKTSVGTKIAEDIGTSDNNSSPVIISPENSMLNKKDPQSIKRDALLQEIRQKQALSNAENSNISIELGTDENVNNLEKLWTDISTHYSAALGKYQPFYSVDAPADGQGKDVFHLRVGPISNLEEGDNICSQLGRNGIFCSVVRIQ